MTREEIVAERLKFVEGAEWAWKYNCDAWWMLSAGKKATVMHVQAIVAEAERRFPFPPEPKVVEDTDGVRYRIHPTSGCLEDEYPNTRGTWRHCAYPERVRALRELLSSEPAANG